MSLTVIYTGEAFNSEDVLQQNSVFLVGPNKRSNSGSFVSYRNDIVKMLDASGFSGIVFNPEAVVFEKKTPDEITKIAEWELQALACSKIIICGFDTDLENQGLTTRVEFGMNCMIRKNIVCYWPDASYNCEYMTKRAIEKNLQVCTTLDEVVKYVNEMITQNLPTIQYDQRFSAYSIHPNECDVIVLESVLQDIARKATKASYVYLKPKDRFYNEATLLEKHGYTFYKYLHETNVHIYMKWHNEDECMVPHASTSVIGACMIITRNNKKELLLTYEANGNAHLGYRTPSEAGNFGENIVMTFKRGLQEELNYVANSDTVYYFAGAYSLANAREGGIADNCFNIACDLPADTEFTLSENGEITSYKWIDLSDYTNYQYLFVDESNQFVGVVNGTVTNVDRRTTTITYGTLVIPTKNRDQHIAIDTCDVTIANGKITGTAGSGKQINGIKVDTYMIDAVKRFVGGQAWPILVNGGFAKY